jgi:hypothetical protein
MLPPGVAERGIYSRSPPLRTTAQSGGILSGKTLSGQSENKAGVGVVVRPETAMSCLKVGLESGAPSESGVDVMPPFKFITLA